jgi:hypothetical protein
MGRKNITAYVTEELATTLQRLSAQQGVSVSKLAGEFLESGFQSSGEKATERLMIPRLEETLTRVLKEHSNRVASLNSRAAINAGISRRMIRAFIGVQVGDDLAKQAEDQARREEVIDLKNKHSEVSEMARELARELTTLDARDAA